MLGKLIAKITPVGWLPMGSKVVDGTRYALNKAERREELQRHVDHKFTALRDRWSPVARLLKFKNQKRAMERRARLHELVGRIALAHAGIEQGNKASLVGDWDVLEKFEEPILEQDGSVKLDAHGNRQKRTVQISSLFGERLRKRFLREIKLRRIPKAYLDRYTSLFEEFEELSQKRNLALKTRYAIYEETGIVARVNDMAFHT